MSQIIKRGGVTYIDGVAQYPEGHPGPSEAETYPASDVAPIASESTHHVDQTAQAGAPVHDKPAKAPAKRPAKAVATKAAAKK